MKPRDVEEEIRRFYDVHKLCVRPSDDLDDRVLADARRASDKSSNLRSTEANVWRKIMESKIAKLTAAGAILIGAFVALFGPSRPAWAIEETIETLKKYRALKLESVDNEMKCWAVADESLKVAESVRVELANGELVVAKAGDFFSYHYKPQENTVYILRAKPAYAYIYPWLGPDFFEFMKKMPDCKVKYGKDPVTEEKRAYLTGSNRTSWYLKSFWVEFDTKTKLPLRLKQWENLHHQGKPSTDARVSYFEDLSDEMFEFDIPPHAKVVEQIEYKAGLGRIKDPSVGMSVGDLSRDEAAKEIVRQYWQAILEKDWDLLGRLHPAGSAKDWEQAFDVFRIYGVKKLVEVGDPQHGYSCLGPAVPCTVELETGTVQFTMIVRFGSIDGRSSCVIVDIWDARTVD